MKDDLGRSLRPSLRSSVEGPPQVRLTDTLWLSTVNSLMGSLQIPLWHSLHRLLRGPLWGWLITETQEAVREKQT